MPNRTGRTKPLRIVKIHDSSKVSASRSGKAVDLAAPANAEELGQFVREHFGISIPDRSMCPNHDAPLDYLSASFLGQEDLLVWANRGGGKTMIAAVATLLDAMFRYPVQILVLGGSFDQSDRLGDYIRRILQRHPELIEGRMTRDKYPLVGGSEVRVLAQSQRAVRGQHAQKIRCDEVDLFDNDVWRAVQFATHSHERARGSIEVLSTLHRTGGLMQQLVDAARRDGDAPSHTGYRLLQWCLWEVIERCDEGRRCEDCLLAEDCRGVAREGRGFFSIDDAIAIKARSSRSAWEAEMLCKGLRRDWLVFAEFDPARHVQKVEYCVDWPTYRAIDFGYRSPLVCLWIQLTPSGRVHVLGEYVRTQLPVAQHAAAILKQDVELTGQTYPKIAMTYVDPAGRQREATSGSACTEILAAAGIQCAWRASTIAEGLELIRSALAPAAGAPTLAVHPRCVELIRAFNGYHYPPPGAHGGADVPVKDGPDHLIDSLRYFFINRCRPKISVSRLQY